MANKKIINIFENTKAKLPNVPSFTPPSDVNEDFFHFSMLDNEDETILTYRNISNDRLSQKLAKFVPNIPNITVWNDCMATALTDRAIYFYTSADSVGESFKFEWEDILSVSSKDYLFIFHVKNDLNDKYAVPAVCLCESHIYKIPSKNTLFVKMLNDMAEAAKIKDLETDWGASLQKQKAYYDDDERDREQARRKAEEERKAKEEIEEQRRQIEEERKELDRRKAEEARKAEAELRAEARRKVEDERKVQPVKGAILSDNIVTITESNIGNIFGAGKENLSSDIDLSAISKFKELEARLDNLKKKEPKTSPLGNSSDINTLKARLSKAEKELEPLQKKLSESKRAWEVAAYSLFVDACRANTRILLGSSGINILEGSKGNGKAPGVYTTTVPVAGTIAADHLPAELAKEFKSNAESLSKIWIAYLNTNAEVWEKVAGIIGKKPDSSSAVKDVISSYEKDLNTNQKQAVEYEAWIKELNAIKKSVDEMRPKKDIVMNSLAEIDPLLTCFSLNNAASVYDRKWLDTVTEVASIRKSMPYLPVYWSDKSFGTVFDWQKAVENGKPNLFIEAETDERLEGRMDMLDNFIATLLLAFPVKDLHITVLEQRTINTFVNELPEKICQVYDVGTDSDAIRAFTRQLKEMYRAGRNNTLPDCCPREIVVIAGFAKKDRIFSDIMENLNEIIENGRRAGIYFAIVLDKDITEYDWKNADANNFEQYFVPYSTILTNKRDKEDNPIPDYRLLQRDADIETDEGVKAGTLAELVTHYVNIESSTVPNKVYGLIENGELYSSSPITNLDEQPKKDIGKLVVPIAETDAGQKLELRLDDESYISCFILGRSGMGKSFTLHTILTNLMLKYDSSTVEIILMDFKPGGVELNYYKDVPHVSSLLVDGADKQVAGEILKSISEEITRRGEIFNKCGVSSISRYNTFASKNGLEPMKHIVLLVDECQDLFKVENPNSDTNIVTEIARKGRSYGIHMILATQTLQKTDIPSDALGQFSDFLFMGCKEDDVVKCEISDREVQKQVGQLVKGEVIYCHRGSEPQHGYIYNYYGKDGVYHSKTQKHLLSSQFTKPTKKQFYFTASQSYKLDKSELSTLINAATTGLKPVPMAVIGKNLSVKSDTLYSRFGSADSTNLLILGENGLLQGERVLWNAVVSLYECNSAIERSSRYYILPNIPEDVEARAIDAHKSRLELLRELGKREGVTIVDEDERAMIIERVAATVRGRQSLAESDRSAVKKLDDIYLIIPNQQLFAAKMGRVPKGLEGLDSNLPISTETKEAKPNDAQTTDPLGFEGLVMPGSDDTTETSNPGFLSVDFGGFDKASSSSNNLVNISAGKPGRNLDEELRYILEYGPAVNVHVILQSTSPDKIYADDSMREKEMNMLFNDMIFLKMLYAGSMSLPIDSRKIEQLSSDPKCLRAIAYNTGRGARTIVPFDIPKLD